MREFATLTFGILLVVVVVVSLLGLMAEKFARFIPFEYEYALAEKYPLQAEAGEPVRVYLQQLAQRLAKAQKLPPEMRITVHYVDSETINAFATLGGHIIVFRGLLEKMPHENALAMVIAHEIAHIKFRHPVMSLGRGAVISIALAAVSGASSESLVNEALGQAGLLTLLRFSRDQESQADEAALETVAREYGHTAGADILFRILESTDPGAHIPPQFLSTHPVSASRVKALSSLAQARGWPHEGATRAIPTEIAETLAIHAGEKR